MNTPLPKHIQQQLAKAEELRSKLQDAPTSDAPNGEQVGTPAPGQPEAPEAVQAAQETPVQPAPPAAPEPKVEDWEHKYKVLQGIHQADAQRNRELIETNKQLRELIATLQAPPAQPAAPASADGTYKYVKPEEVEDYGAELLDVAARRAREQYQPLVDTLQQQVAALQGQLANLAGKTERVEELSVDSAKDRFFVKLTELAPTWRNLNEDEGFLSWLDGMDDLSGAPRRDMFDSALGRLDAARVAKFFTAYSGVAPAPQVTAPPPQGMVPVVPAEELVAPGKTRGGAAPAGKKTYSRNDIAAFYERCRIGYYKGKDAERRAAEEDIFAAQRDGRIAA